MIDVAHVHAHVEAVVRYGAEHPAEFAGAVVDPHPPGLVHVGFTGGLPEHERELAGLLPYERWVSVFEARRSLRELRALVDRVLEDEGQLLRLGVEAGGVGIDVRANRVWAEVSDARAGDLLRERYGDELRVIEVAERRRVPLQVVDSALEGAQAVRLTFLTSAGRPAAEHEVIEHDDAVGIRLYALVPPWVGSEKLDRRKEELTVRLPSPLAGRRLRL